MPSKPITLNPCEQRLAKFIAECRTRVNRNNGVKNQKAGPQSTQVTELEGVGGELAFCKHHNIYPELITESCESIFSAKHGTDFGDVVLMGKHIDVKTSKRLNAHLVISEEKLKAHVTYFALMIGEMPSYQFVGFYPLADLQYNEIRTDKCFWIKQHQLSYSFVSSDFF